MEKYKDIQNYEGIYQVSNLGNIKSLERLIKDGRTDKFRKRKEIIIKSKNNNKYSQVVLAKDGYRKQFLVHRLVAMAFIDNPLNKEQVNHINGIKSDNSIDNLEWCNSSENVTHAYKTGLSISFWAGKKRSEEDKKKMSLAKIGKESKLKGTKKTEEVKLKSSKTWFKKGQIPHNKKTL